MGATRNLESERPVLNSVPATNGSVRKRTEFIVVNPALPPKMAVSCMDTARTSSSTPKSLDGKLWGHFRLVSYSALPNSFCAASSFAFGGPLCGTQLHFLVGSATWRPEVSPHNAEAIAMVGGPTTDDLEGSKGRILRFVLAVGILTACLIAVFLFIGFGGFGFDKSLGPTQSPALSGSTK